MTQSYDEISDGFSRRRFLRSLGAGVAASAVAPQLLLHAHAGETKGTPLILGTGNHKYEWVQGWGQLPDGKRYGSLHGGVVVDSKNQIYYSTDGPESIIVLDPNGKYIRSFGAEWKPDKDGNGTHDIQLHKEGNQEFIYLVSLFRHEFAKITLTGEKVWVKGFPEQAGIYKSKDEFKPTGITVAPNGDFYVTDGYGSNYIHHYNAKGDYINSWGGKSSKDKEDGKFSTPHKILIDPRGKEPTVMVTDRANHRLQWFSLDGKHLKTLDGTNEDFLRLPSVLNIRGGDVAIGDLKGRVTILDKENKLVTHIGDSKDEKKQATNRIPSDQWVDGQFIAPHGLSWDKQGSLYISEWSLGGRVVKLKRVK
jgi:DNA-binding beta-propeller fold protein YncE